MAQDEKPLPRWSQQRLIWKRSFHTQHVLPVYYEQDGVDYHFITEEAFKKMQNNQEFLETVDIDGIHYGIREEDIVKAFENHNLVYLTLNPEGTEKLKEMYGDRCHALFRLR